MNSTNIKVMSEEIQHLKNEVHNLDVEIPDHPATDAGKYLGVAADGSLAWSKVQDELPPTTGATAGQILALDNDKAPEWADNYNLNYSENEINTGKKWGNDNIYCTKISGEIGEIATGTFIDSTLIIDKLISCGGFVQASDGFQASVNSARTSQTATAILKRTTGYISLYVGQTFSGGSYEYYVEYTKPTPSALTSSDPTREAEPEIIEEPEPETKSTRTKKSTK